ncbi:MAG: hypothetical protein NZ700_02495 [Gemmataceae bacterium]|nr:hypothetical protein [Gemmataceae bacterium]MDW8264297.1 hypothetical protein [Gemmataceae bacterium]
MRRTYLLGTWVVGAVLLGATASGVRGVEPGAGATLAVPLPGLGEGAAEPVAAGGPPAATRVPPATATATAAEPLAATGAPLATEPAMSTGSPAATETIAPLTNETLVLPAEAFASGTIYDWVVIDTHVGIIDPAFPMSIVRLRYDDATGMNRPSRAEYFYARGAPFGPGLPLPESNVNYQELGVYLEWAAYPRFSVFVDAPTRFLDPTINTNSAGFSDLITGFKWAWLFTEQAVATFQFKTYIPTGDADRGLGTDHVSLEPGFLLFWRVGNFLDVEGELRNWIPISGTNFAGDVLRYGLALSLSHHRAADRYWLTPVAEFVGWTVLNGKESVAFSATDFYVQQAGADTIVNVYYGARLGWGQRIDFYGGYGHPLTGEFWYRDFLRFEARLHF